MLIRVPAHFEGKEVTPSLFRQPGRLNNLLKSGVPVTCRAPVPQPATFLTYRLNHTGEHGAALWQAVLSEIEHARPSQALNLHAEGERRK